MEVCFPINDLMYRDVLYGLTECIGLDVIQAKDCFIYMKARFLGNCGCRYPFESLSGIPLQPLYFTEKYLDVKKVLVETFFGPPRGGVYSPSVQSTLYQMAKTVLNRSLSLPPSPPSLSFSLSYTHMHAHPFTDEHLISWASFDIDSWFSFCRFPDILSIQLKMPNLHFLPVNISSKDNPAIVKVELLSTNTCVAV